MISSITTVIPAYQSSLGMLLTSRSFVLNSIDEENTSKYFQSLKSKMIRLKIPLTQINIDRFIVFLTCKSAEKLIP